MVPRPLAAQMQASKSREILHFDFLQMAFTADDEDEYLLVLKDGFIARLLFCSIVGQLRRRQRWKGLQMLFNFWRSKGVGI